MKRNVAFLSAFVLAGSLSLLASPAAFSGGTSSTHSNAKSTAKHALFNPSSMETVQGKVAAITIPKGKKGMAAEERIELKTDHGTMPVLLGPASFVGKERVKVNKGDQVSVTGSSVTMHKRKELVATEIKKGNETLDLRKPDGTPLWSAKSRQGK